MLLEKEKKVWTEMKCTGNKNDITSKVLGKYTKSKTRVDKISVFRIYRHFGMG